MSHEQSETVLRNGRWVNVYGRHTPKAGQPLPFPQGPVPFGERASYSTVGDADQMAALRSQLHGFETPHPEEEEAKLQRYIDQMIQAGGMNVR
jgi:hypothetical protein